MDSDASTVTAPRHTRRRSTSSGAGHVWGGIAARTVTGALASGGASGAGSGEPKSSMNRISTRSRLPVSAATGM